MNNHELESPIDLLINNIDNLQSELSSFQQQQQHQVTYHHHLAPPSASSSTSSSLLLHLPKERQNLYDEDSEDDFSESISPTSSVSSSSSSSLFSLDHRNHHNSNDEDNEDNEDNDDDDYDDGDHQEVNVVEDKPQQLEELTEKDPPSSDDDDDNDDDDDDDVEEEDDGQKERRKQLRKPAVSKTKLIMLFAVLSSQLLADNDDDDERRRATKKKKPAMKSTTPPPIGATFECRLPLTNQVYHRRRTKPHYMEFSNSVQSWGNIYEQIEIMTPLMDIYQIMNEYSVILEFKRYGSGSSGENRTRLDTHDSPAYFGITMLPLKNFAPLFTSDTGHYIKSKETLPEIGYDGYVIVKNPFTNRHVAKIKVLVSLGTVEQTQRFKAQLFDEPMPSNRTTRAKKKQHIHEHIHHHELPPIVRQNKIDTHVSDRESKRARTEEQETRAMSKIVATEEKRNITPQKHEPLPITATETREQQDLYIPSFLPFSHVSRITIHINRATGLQEAARLVGKNNSLMQLAAQVGVNAFVQFKNILPLAITTSMNGELSADETKIKAGSFCPVWNYTKLIDVVIDEIVYSHIMQSEIELKFYHRISVNRMAGEDASKGKNILLGVCTIPLHHLLTSKSGIDGWYNIYGCGTMVGAVELSIQLDEKTKKILFRTETQHTQDVNQCGGTGVYDVCRFSLFVEEMDIPSQTLRDVIPNYLLRENDNLSCSYYISYKFFDEKRVESRRYQASTSQHKIYMEYGAEYKRVMDPMFVNLITCEKMPMNLYVNIGSSPSNSKLLGSIYVDLGPLYKRQQISKKKLVFISGIYTLINPRSSNLSGGHMKVKVCCETLSRTAAQQYMTEMNYRSPGSNSKSNAQFHSATTDDEDSDDSTECSITEDTDRMDDFIFEENFVSQVPKRIRSEVVKTDKPVQTTMASTPPPPSTQSYMSRPHQFPEPTSYTSPCSHHSPISQSSYFSPVEQRQYQPSPQQSSWLSLPKRDDEFSFDPLMQSLDLKRKLQDDIKELDEMTRKLSFSHRGLHHRQPVITRANTPISTMNDFTETDIVAVPNYDTLTVASAVSNLPFHLNMNRNDTLATGNMEQQPLSPQLQPQQHSQFDDSLRTPSPKSNEHYDEDSVISMISDHQPTKMTSNTSSRSSHPPNTSAPITPSTTVATTTTMSKDHMTSATKTNNSYLHGVVDGTLDHYLDSDDD